MTYSYTQISQYLTCPRRYRHRYLDGWKEKDTRAAMLFGRAFERALGALFRREDPGSVLFAEWSGCQSQALPYSNRDSWDRMLRQGITLLTRFCQDNRVQVFQPRRNLQVKFMRPVAGSNDFVAYVDAIGKLDDKRRRRAGRRQSNGVRFRAKPSCSEVALYNCSCRIYPARRTSQSLTCNAAGAWVSA